jgi:hypothetical protein
VLLPWGKFLLCHTPIKPSWLFGNCIISLLVAWPCDQKVSIKSEPHDQQSRNPHANDTTPRNPKNQVWKCDTEITLNLSSNTINNSQTRSIGWLHKDNYSSISRFSSLENRSRRILSNTYISLMKVWKTLHYLSNGYL